MKDTDVFEDGKRKLKNTHLRTSISLGMQESQDGSLNSDSNTHAIYIFSIYLYVRVCEFDGIFTPITRLH